MGTPGFTADCDDARDYFDSYDDLDVSVGSVLIL